MQAGEEENKASMKTLLVWNTHSSKWGRRAEGYTRDGKFSKQHRRNSDSRKPGCAYKGTDGSTALRSRDSYLY